MKKAIIAAITLLMSMNIHAQEIPKAYRVSTDTVSGSLVLKGLITFNLIKDEPTFDWYEKSFDNYESTPEDITELTKYLNKYTMVVFMGTWCEDSQNMIPGLAKVLTDAKMDLHKVVMYGVDRAKTVGNGMEKTYNVTLVPTIILFDGKKEVGRITENVHKSVESDLANMIKKHELEK